MIAYKIQLRYVIRDKILLEKKILGFCLGLNFVSDLILSRISSAFFLVISDKSMLIITKRYIQRNKDVLKVLFKYPLFVMLSAQVHLTRSAVFISGQATGSTTNSNFNISTTLEYTRLKIYFIGAHNFVKAVSVSMLGTLTV